MRLVPNQEWNTSLNVHKTFHEYRSDSVTVKVTPHHGGQGYVTDSIGYKAANMAYTETLEFRYSVRSGGSIPIVALFEKELKAKQS
jgi:hypothetical protein